MLVRPEPPLPGPQPQSGTTSPTGTDAPSPCGRSARDRAAVRRSPVAPRRRRRSASQGHSASMAEVPGEQVAGGAVQVAAAAVVAAGGARGRRGPWRPAGPAGWRRRPGSAWRRCAHRVRRQPRGQGGRENGGAAEARVASRVPRPEQGVMSVPRRPLPWTIALLGADLKRLGRIMEFCRLFLAPYGSAGGVKDLFKGIHEAGVTVIEDGSVPRRDLEAAMSRALTDLLQVHPLVDGPADPRVAGIVGRKGLG